MESTGSKGELIKPILIMAGIPLAFSVVNYLIARITDTKFSSLQAQIQETSPEMEFVGMHGADDDDIDNTHEMDHLKDQISSLRSKLKELQESEMEIERPSLNYNDLKDQEYALMEVKSGLVIEKERAEFLEKEALSMEAENKRFDEMVMQYLKALEELESSRLENGLLRRRVKKLLKRTKENSRLMRKQKLKIESREAKSLLAEVELKRKENMIRGFENEIKDMLRIINQLRDEKNEVLNKLKMEENEVSSKAKTEAVLMENYNRVVNELENLRKDRAAEVKELIYLRWCHACLKHELARRNQLEQERISTEKRNEELGLGFGENGVLEECTGHDSDIESVLHHDEPFFGARASDEQHTKRPWLVRKFKKWVDGCEKEKPMAGRKSFSSA